MSFNFIAAYVALFTLPKVYETNKQSIDAYLDLVRSKINEITEKWVKHFASLTLQSTLRLFDKSKGYFDLFFNLLYFWGIFNIVSLSVALFRVKAAIPIGKKVESDKEK